MNDSAYVGLLEDALDKIGTLTKSPKLETASIVLRAISTVIEAIRQTRRGTLDIKDAAKFVDDQMRPLLGGLAQNDAEIDELLAKKS